MHTCSYAAIKYKHTYIFVHRYTHIHTSKYICTYVHKYHHANRQKDTDTDRRTDRQKHTHTQIDTQITNRDSVIHGYSLIWNWHLQTRITQQPHKIETCSFHCYKAHVLLCIVVYRYLGKRIDTRIVGLRIAIHRYIVVSLHL